MTVFGTIGLFVRRIEITSAELALCRAGLAAVFLLLSFLVTRRRLCLSEIKKSLWLLLASGAAMGINWMLLFEAYQVHDHILGHAQLLSRTRARHGAVPAAVS